MHIHKGLHSYYYDFNVTEMIYAHAKPMLLLTYIQDRYWQYGNQLCIDVLKETLGHWYRENIIKKMF